MKKQKYASVWISIVILMLLLVACNPISLIVQHDAQASSSMTDPLQGQLTIENSGVFDYQLFTPEEWTGKVEQRQAGNMVYFDYQAEPKNPLFSISGFNEAQWQEAVKEPGHGKEILTKDGVVFAYNIALDNPYTGNQAEEFQLFAGQVSEVAASLTVTAALPNPDIDQARHTLENFFYLLSNGKYFEAVKLYGGSYEELIAVNPGIDPKEHAALLENGCRINGYKCLQAREIVQAVQDWPDTFTFTVTFSNPDGTLFELDACCGDVEADTSLQSKFDFTVMRVAQAGNSFLVQRLPVYVP